MAKVMMVQGTMSNAGKSFLLALTLIAHTVESCHQIGEAFVLHVWQLEGFVISHFENT